VFRGRFEHTVDDKGRVAIPSRFRDLLSRDGEQATVVITNFDRCLSGYSLPEWEKLETKIATMPQFDPKTVGFLRYFISGAIECPVDKAGRILVPANLRQFAGIENECVFAGALTKFEIWSANRWQQEFDCIADQFTPLMESMSKLGINL